MTTITIEEKIVLPETFATYQDLVDFVLYDNTHLTIEELNQDEKQFITRLSSFQEFKKIANTL
jgi:hypothetical protein